MEHAAVLNQLAEGVVVTDAAGRIVFVNEAAARLHGVTRLDVGPEAYSQSYHLYTEDGRPYPSTELPLARAVLRGDTITDARWRIRRLDGSEVLAVGSAARSSAPIACKPVPCSHSATRLPATRPGGHSLTSEAIEGAILEAALDCVVTIDHKSGVVEWNPAAERTFGHLRETVLGRDMPDLIIPPSCARRIGAGWGITWPVAKDRCWAGGWKSRHCVQMARVSQPSSPSRQPRSRAGYSSPPIFGTFTQRKAADASTGRKRGALPCRG